LNGSALLAERHSAKLQEQVEAISTAALASNPAVVGAIRIALQTDLPV
jgi:hypothetical protein